MPPKVATFSGSYYWIYLQRCERTPREKNISPTRIQSQVTWDPLKKKGKKKRWRNMDMVPLWPDLVRLRISGNILLVPILGMKYIPNYFLELYYLYDRIGQDREGRAWREGEEGFRRQQIGGIWLESVEEVGRGRGGEDSIDWKKRKMKEEVSCIC